MMETTRHPDNSGEIPRRWFYGVLLLLSLVLSSSAVIAAYTLSMNALGWEGGRSSSLSVPLGGMMGAKQQNVMLYASPDTRQYLSNVGGNYEVLLKPWRNFLVQEQIPFTEVTKIPEKKRSASDTLILPSVLALGEQERNALIAYRNAGGSILVTSSLAVRDGQSKWMGYDYLETLLGVRVTGDFPPDQDERNLNLFGDLPFTQSYSAGKRLYLGKLGDNPLRLAGGMTAASITNWARTTTDGPKDLAAVVYDEFGPSRDNGRWAMLSFSETTWDVERNAIHPFLTNVIEWLGHKPSIYQASWPAPYRAAHIFEMDTEKGFPNALRFAELMEKIDVTATFYMLTSVAVKYPDIVRQLAKRHEVAYHAELHNGFKDLPEDIQKKRLQAMQADMKSILGDTTGITGFRAPTESYDKVTEDLLLQMGIRHHAADPNRTSGRLPLFYPDVKGGAEQALVVLPRTQLDDLNILAAASSNPRKVTDALIQDFENVVQMGGLGLLSVHSQYFSDFSPLFLGFPAYLEHVSRHRKEVWMAPSGAVSNWWRERERLTFKTTVTQNNIRLDVTITGTQPAAPVSLIVAHPITTSTLQVRPVTSRTVLPQVRRIDRFRSALVFSDMKPGTYIYTVDFDNAQNKPAMKAENSTSVPNVRP